MGPCLRGPRSLRRRRSLSRSSPLASASDFMRRAALGFLAALFAAAWSPSMRGAQLLQLAAAAQWDDAGGYQASGSGGQWGGGADEGAKLGTERVVFQTNYGDIEFGFFPTVAPVTVQHISRLAHLGCYTTNHFFRVDRGFVAQVADVVGGRTARMNAVQQAEAEKRVPGEFSAVKHTRGILSMGRYDDPNSATSSFSILLGDAPHLDGKYAVFGRLTAGDSVLSQFENLPTRSEGIFVMPLERISIVATYVYDLGSSVPPALLEDTIDRLKRKLVQAEADLQETRRKCLP